VSATAADPAGALTILLLLMLSLLLLLWRRRLLQRRLQRRLLPLLTPLLRPWLLHLGCQGSYQRLGDGALPVVVTAARVAGCTTGTELPSLVALAGGAAASGGAVEPPSARLDLPPLQPPDASPGP